MRELFAFPTFGSRVELACGVGRLRGVLWRVLRFLGRGGGWSARIWADYAAPLLFFADDGIVRGWALDGIFESLVGMRHVPLGGGSYG